VTTDLGRLLKPRTIAVMGGHWAENVIEQCQRMGFDGELWPVNPNRSKIGGLACFRSIAELPTAPDATFIGINRHATIGAVGELAERGAGGAICFASGFSEATAEDQESVSLQEALLEAAGDMPILGPNCYGLINYLDGAPLWPDQHGGRRETTGVAILTQSSNIAINMTMQHRALPVAYVVTAGNQAQIRLAELGMALLEDERVTALGLHIEGFGDLRSFEALAARARTYRKPMVALKVGRSLQARAAMISHTNSLAGEDAAARALLARLDIPELHSVPEFLETLKLLHVQGPLTGHKIASMSCSGGEAALMADAAESRALTYPALEQNQIDSLRATLGPLVALANPLDFHTFIWNDVPAMTATFRAMLEGEADLTFLVLDLPRQDSCDPASWYPALDALAAARDATGNPVAVVATMAENMPEDTARSLAAVGITPLSGIAEALAAAEAAANCGDGLTHPLPAPLLLPTYPSSNARLLSEAQAKDMLRTFGLRTPRGRIAVSTEEVVQMATEIGFPVVLKGQGIAHKSEVGLIQLGLVNAEQTREAAAKMEAMTSGFLVEELIEDVVAELLVGVVRDPAHGFLLTIAAGGVLTELFRDQSNLLLPAADAEIDAALTRLCVAPLLDGYRGRPGADRPSIVATTRIIGDFVAAHADTLEEIEINPLLCRNQDTIVADALITLRTV